MRAMKRRTFCASALGSIAAAALPAAELRTGALESLRRSLRGDVLTPQDPAYEKARHIWNGAFDRRPAAIARCVDADDVSRAVMFAREHALPLAVRGGGHSLPGHSTCDGGLVIDLSRMRAVQVDSGKRMLRAQGGALLADIDSATVAQSLVMPAGTMSQTGIGGLALGGGFGRLARKWGLACDQLLAAELVTADGKRLRASAHEEPDLYWALRGGGGNFGVVTSFEFRLHELPRQMLGGPLVFAMQKPRELLRAYADFAATVSDDFFSMVDIVPTPDGGRAIAIETFHCGAPAVAQRELDALRGIGTRVQDGVKAAPYPTLQSAGDKDYPTGRGYYLKSGHLDALSGKVIDTLVDHLEAHPSARRVAAFLQLGGAISRVPPRDTAYWHRRTQFHAVLVGVWDNPADADASREWVRSGWREIEPLTDGFYVNFMSPDDAGRRLRSSYSGNFERLLGIKQRYDPDNLFRLNANLRSA